MDFWQYIRHRRMLAESILDKPKIDLDPAVWTKNAKGEYIPTIQASQKIDVVARWAVSKFGISDPVLHITGSIASNSFSDASDIDLHFCSETFKPDDAEEFNKEFRAAFKAEFGEETGSENGFIGVHPIEVYFQTNMFQDMMSVGCYNYFERKWEAGPEIKDTVFDPYSEYYEQDMKYIDSLINDIRNQILEPYELALVIRKTEDLQFKAGMAKKLGKSLKEAGKLFESIRKTRKIESSPKSREEALKKRKDRKWHIADSTFKLLDKFGYLSILSAYTRLVKDFDETRPNAAIDEIIDVVRENITSNKMLTDSEKSHFTKLSEDDIDEGLGSAIRAAALAGAMAMPFAVQAKIPDARPKAAQVQQTQAEQKYAGLSRSNMTNLLATIAYNESMLDWMKNKNDDAIIAILNVIDNRAGGKPEHYAEVISEKSQFFSVKHVKGGYVDGTYRRYSPQSEAKAAGRQLSPKQKECWDLCVKYAGQLLDGTLPKKIGSRNMIANPAKDKKSALDAWGSKCDLAIEGHRFGYDKKHDGYVRYGGKPAQNVHIVKSGDSLWKIAKAYGLTVDELKTKNGLKTDTIRPGQKLNV